MYDVLIIGGGAAGMTAGLYAARAGLKVLIIEKGFAGGQASTTNWIENYPGPIQTADEPGRCMQRRGCAELS